MTAEQIRRRAEREMHDAWRKPLSVTKEPETRVDTAPKRPTRPETRPTKAETRVDDYELCESVIRFDGLLANDLRDQERAESAKAWRRPLRNGRL